MRTDYITSYTNGAYKDLITAGGQGLRVRSLTISNSSTAVNALVRVLRKNTDTVLILPTTSIEQNGSYSLDLMGLGLEAGDKLQAQGSAAGLNFYATSDEN